MTIVTETRVEVGGDSDGYYYGRVYDATPGDFYGRLLYSGPARGTEERAVSDAKRWQDARE